MFIRLGFVSREFVLASHVIRSVAIAVVGASLPSMCLGQCEKGWLPGDGVTGVNGLPAGLATWDPDGSGPRGPLVVVRGSINCAGRTAVNRLAAWDAQTDTWHDLNSAAIRDVETVRGLPDGRLLAWTGSSGLFLDGTSSALAVYDGSTWKSLSPALGPGRAITCAAMAPNGDIVVGGEFSAINGTDAQNVARWNGTTWSALGGGVSTRVAAIDVLSGGDVVVLAKATAVYSDVPRVVQRFSAGAWSLVGPVMQDEVSVLRALPGGDFVIARSGRGGNVYRLESNLNGTFWESFGSISMRSDVITDIQPIDANNVFVIGNGLQAGDSNTYSLVKLPRGGAAAGLCTSISGGYRSGVVLPDQQFVIIPKVDVLPVGGYISRWTGSAWLPLEISFSRAISIDCAVPTPSGETFASGLFVDPSGTTRAGFAKQEGGVWQPFEAGGLAPRGPMHAGADGLLAFGVKQTVNSVYMAGVAIRRDGIWSNSMIGSAELRCITQTANGTLFVGGDYISTSLPNPMIGVATWDGAAWVTAGDGLANPPTRDWGGGESVKSTVYALCPLRDGRLLAVGEFSLSAATTLNGVAIWNGGGWSPLGNGIPNFNLGYHRTGRCATQMNTGDILVGGAELSTTDASVAIVRWDGTSWTPFARCLDARFQNGFVFSLICLSDGSIVASGRFDSIDGVVAKDIAIWDGAWHPLSTPGPGGIEVISDWTKVVPSPDGGFVAFGDFNTMNGGLAASYAKWGCRTRCVADFNSSGAVSFEDFDAFVAALEAGTGTADINNDGFLTFEDFDAFVIAFEAGC